MEPVELVRQEREGVVSYVRPVLTLVPPLPARVMGFVIRDPRGRALEELDDLVDANVRSRRLNRRCSVYKRLRAFVVLDRFGKYVGDADSLVEAGVLAKGFENGTTRPARPDEEVALSHAGPGGWNGKSR